MKEKEIVGYKCGTCPCCGSTELKYGDNEIDDEFVYFYFTCQDCGACGSEEHYIVFNKMICDTY